MGRLGILPGTTYLAVTGAPPAWRRYRRAKGDEADPVRGAWLSLLSRRDDSDGPALVEGWRASRPSTSRRPFIRPKAKSSVRPSFVPRSLLVFVQEVHLGHLREDEVQELGAVESHLAARSSSPLGLDLGWMS